MPTFTGNANANTLTGGNQNDLLIGLGGADTLNGNGGIDTASYVSSAAAVNVNLSLTTAQSGGDAQGDILNSIENLIGSAFADWLTGNTLANTLDGGLGDDTINGGAGNDILIGGGGADVIVGGTGVDTASYANSSAGVTIDLNMTTTGQVSTGDASGDLLTEIENLVGSAFADTLIGNAQANTLDGGAGNDLLIGGAGSDVLIGGAGLDTASYASSGAGVSVNLTNTTTGQTSTGDANGDRLTGIENLIGSAFTDTLVGDNAANVMDGGAGNDSITGGGGNDTLTGGAGADSLAGGTGIDTASYAGSSAGITVNLANTTTAQISAGDASGDVLSAIENLVGSSFNDILSGSASANNLSGGDGDDILTGAAGADTVNGGAGQDTANYSTSNQGVTVNLMLTTGQTSSGHATGDILLGIENLTGSTFTDTLTGDALANVLDGGEGVDTLIGGAGDDQLIGGAAADTLNGGTGVDTAVYTSSSVGVTINLTNTTTGQTSAGDASGDILTGIENLTGSALNDTLTGDAAANSMDGGAGDDTFTGGAGADAFIGGADIDTASYAASLSGVRVILDPGVPKTGGDAEGDTLTQIENLVGSAFADTLAGDAGNNVLTGGGGDDLLAGEGGINTIDGGDGNDIIVCASGQDTVIGGLGTADLVLYSTSDEGVSVNLSTGVLSGGYATGDTLSGIENVNGSNFADNLIGNAGNNELHGGAGDDFLAGEAGVNTLIGGEGADFFSTNSGQDTALGGEGNDVFVDYGGGVQFFDGGEGEDTLSYAASLINGVTVDLLAGAGTGGGAQGDSYTSIERVVGTENNNDVILGSDVYNFFDGRGGNDVLRGRGGNDILNGNDGDDTIEGGTGSDEMRGQNGIDTAEYTGSSSGVTVNLGNTITGQTSAGDASGDILTGMENLTGSAFNDTLIGDVGNNVLTGDAGDDLLFAENGNDTINGGNGNDILVGGAGSDTLNGGSGFDTVSYAGASEGATINLFMQTHSWGAALGDTFSQIEQVIGTDFSDVFWTGGYDVTFYGGGGSDQFSSSAAVETCVGGAGLDSISYFSSSVGVNINLELGTASGGLAEGDVLSEIEIITGAYNHSNTIIGDAASNQILGGTQADSLFGGDGADSLQARGGNDVLDGGAGDDHFFLDTGTETVSGGEGSDTLYSYGPEGVTINLALGIGVGGYADGTVFTSIENARGSNSHDILMGDAGANLLYAEDGDDFVEGGAGADLLYGNAGLDTVSYASSSAGVTVDFNIATQISSGDAAGDLVTGFENVIGSAFDDTLTGDALANILDGGYGDDVLNGGDGDDVLIGGLGNDTLNGGAGGADIFVHSLMQITAGNDIVQAFDVAIDIIEVDGLVDCFWNLSNMMTDTPSGVSIQFDDGSSMLLEGIAKSSLAASNFTIGGNVLPEFSSNILIAVGTSAATVNSIIQNTAAGSIITFEDGTHIFNDQLEVSRGDITLRGMSEAGTILQFDLPVGDEGNFINVNGGVKTYSTVLSSGVGAGSTIVTVDSSATLAVGDKIYLYEPNTQAYLDANGWTNVSMTEAQNRPFREFITEVTAIDGNTITLADHVPYDFAATETRVFEIELFENLHLTDFTVTSAFPPANPFTFVNTQAAYLDAVAISVVGTDGLEMSRISVLNAPSTAINLLSTTHAVVDDIYVSGSLNKGGDGNGYGIELSESFNNYLTGLEIFDVRHSVIFSSWNAETGNAVEVISTNRDINFHGSPDNGNNVTVSYGVLSYDLAQSPDVWSIVSGGGTNHAATDIFGNNSVTFVTAIGSTAVDTIYGTDGGSYLNGKGSNDVLFGGASQDMIVGGLRRDTMTGNTGSDTFVLQLGDDLDTITDFAWGVGGDILVFTGNPAVDGVEDLILTQDGANLRVRYGVNSTVILENHLIADLDAANLVFDPTGANYGAFWAGALL